MKDQNLPHALRGGHLQHGAGGSMKDYMRVERNKAKQKALENFEHLVSIRDTKSELRKEHNYWKNKKGKKNLKITSEKSESKEPNVYNTRIMVRKGH